MDWSAWAPTYEAILADFGYAREADEAARDLLDDLVADRLQADVGSLRDALRGREAWIVGAAATREDIRRIPPDAPLLVADAAAALVIPLRRPLAVVTDLDGDVPAQALGNALGIPLVLHAHGDNVAALREHVPRLRGPVLGTTQSEPRGRVRNFGGFTDGDRACCLAVHLGATGLALVGFDFETPAAKPGRDPAVKARKLAWAKRILDGLGVPYRFVSASIHV